RTTSGVHAPIVQRPGDIIVGSEGTAQAVSGGGVVMTASRTRAILLGLALVAAAGFIAVFGNAFATRAYLDQAAARGETTLRLAVAALSGHMSRFEPLPELIADHDDIQALVADPDNALLRAQANIYLKEINA